jgi:hypothetical protein
VVGRSRESRIRMEQEIRAFARDGRTAENRTAARLLDPRERRERGADRLFDPRCGDGADWPSPHATASAAGHQSAVRMADQVYAGYEVK